MHVFLIGSQAHQAPQRETVVAAAVAAVAMMMTVLG